MSIFSNLQFIETIDVDSMIILSSLIKISHLLFKT